ncbi:glycosyltransferase family 2 protein [Seonamhaeicola sp.]|uniref:glycosyltransferase family 2 protein n=1 Tax=Seonamhaeicola sp. TaxID=1912245 RepID=UPI00261F181F|nr:glycosyltransferase family 2 protein [Seonamhaeicola sp.]
MSQKKTYPYFSVVIPLYNKSKYILNTITSVLNQTFQDFEIIVVDDGSTDDGFEKVSKIKNPKITLYKQENAGASVARNIGIEKSNSKYIALLDADDFWHKNHLSELKRLIERFPEAGLFCNNYEIKRNKNFITPASFNFKYSNDLMILKDFFKANIISFIPTSSSTAFLKTSFKKIGSYDTFLRTGQDIDLWIRLALHYDVAFNPEVTMTYNNFDNTSLSKSNYNLDRYELINKYEEEELLNSSLKLYLDINRYALAIRCHLNDEYKLYQKLKKEINYKNLNLKQKFLLLLPKPLLKQVKLFQKFLLKKKVYLTAYN